MKLNYFFVCVRVLRSLSFSLNQFGAVGKSSRQRLHSVFTLVIIHPLLGLNETNCSAIVGFVITAKSCQINSWGTVKAV